MEVTLQLTAFNALSSAAETKKAAGKMGHCSRASLHHAAGCQCCTCHLHVCHPCRLDSKSNLQWPRACTLIAKALDEAMATSCWQNQQRKPQGLTAFPNALPPQGARMLKNFAITDPQSLNSLSMGGPSKERMAQVGMQVKEKPIKADSRGFSMGEK